MIRILAGAVLILVAFDVSLGQVSNIRRSDLKSAAYRDAARTLREYWGDEDWAQESNIQGFQTDAVYGDLTGDGSEEAAVQVHYTMGGSGSFTGVFVYALEGGSPKLIATVRGGDRAHGGIKGVRIRNGQLLVENYRPDGEDCMSCYGSVLVSRYEWIADKLVNVGGAVRALPRRRATRTRRSSRNH